MEIGARPSEATIKRRGCLLALYGPNPQNPFVSAARKAVCYLRDIEAKTQRVTALMTTAEVWQVDEWRHRQIPLPSRGAALRRLIRLGLKAAETAEKARKAARVQTWG